MAGGKKTSSDRLLEMIRTSKGEGQSPPAGGPAPAAPSAEGPPPQPAAAPAQAPPAAQGKTKPKAKPKKAVKPARKPMMKSGRGGGSQVVIGVDLGPDSLRLAKMSGSVGRRKLLAFKRVNYEPNALPNTPEFVGFLRSKLKEFTKGARNAQVWSLILSAKAELWNIMIPKVPRRQILDAVYWSVKKEKQFDEAEYILDFDVVGEAMDKGVPKLEVTVCLAPRAQVDDISNLFAKAGYKLAGVTVAPIAIQTIFRSNWIQTGASTYANLYVGRNWSRIDIFNKGNLVLSRGIKAGTNSMVEALVDSYNMRSGPGGGGGLTMDTIMTDEPVLSMSLGDDTPAVVEQLGGDAAPGGQLDFEQAKKVLAAKLLDGPLQDGVPGTELSDNDVMDMILPAAERLVRQIERTFEYHSTTMGNEPVEQIFFSGSICTNKLMLQYMYSQLGIESLLLDPLNQDNPNVGRIQVPESAVDRMEYNLVVGVALSDNSITPNLLYTYKAKEKDRQAQRLDKIVYAVTALILLCLLGVMFWQDGLIDAQELRKSQLTQEAEMYKPKVTKEILNATAQKVSETHAALKVASLRYQGLASMSEITKITPEKVRLLELKYEFGSYKKPEPVETDPVKLAKKRRQKKPQEEPKFVTIDGFIQGDDTEKYESAFVSYMIKIENSPLFELPEIESQSIEEFESRGTVLRFTIKVKLV